MSEERDWFSEFVQEVRSPSTYDAKTNTIITGKPLEGNELKEYKKAFNDSINYARLSPQGKDMIAAWENHVKVNNSKVIMTKAAAISSIDISDANNRIKQDERTEKANNNLVNNTGFERSDGKEFIHWNPDIALSVYKNGGIVVMSPASILFNEIVHLTDINLENNTITKYPGHENEFESSNGKMNYTEYLVVS